MSRALLPHLEKYLYRTLLNPSYLFCCGSTCFAPFSSTYAKSCDSDSLLFTRTLPQLEKRRISLSTSHFQKQNEDENSAAAQIDSLGTWDNRIDLPIMMEASIKHGAPIPRVTAQDVGSSSIAGKRTYQEDRFFIKDVSREVLCAAVFDGHGGSECSEFCFRHFESVLEEWLAKEKDLATVLHKTFLQLHTSYSQWSQEQNKGKTAGSTATICLLRGGVELVVGNVGDSRAVLCRLGEARAMTRDHCPSLLSEKERVEKSGGTVTTDNIGRHMVNGMLSMSRSIGDLHLKSYGVIALPDTRSLRVKHGKDAFLLVVTDGINFVLRDEEAVNIVNQAHDPSAAAKALTEQALSMSSEDNLTALVVPLGSWGKYTKSASMFYSFGIGRDIVKSSRFG